MRMSRGLIRTLLVGIILITIPMYLCGIVVFVVQQGIGERDRPANGGNTVVTLPPNDDGQSVTLTPTIDTRLPTIDPFAGNTGNGGNPDTNNPDSGTIPGGMFGILTDLPGVTPSTPIPLATAIPFFTATPTSQGFVPIIPTSRPTNTPTLTHTPTHTFTPEPTPLPSDTPQILLPPSDTPSP